MARHIEGLLMVVQQLVLAIVHSHHSYIVHGEVVQAAAGIEGLPFAPIALVSLHNLFEALESVQRSCCICFSVGALPELLLGANEKSVCKGT